MEKRLTVKIPIQASYLIDINLEDLYKWLEKYYSSEDSKAYLAEIRTIAGAILNRKAGNTIEGDTFNDTDNTYLTNLLCKYFNDKGFEDIDTESGTDITDIETDDTFLDAYKDDFPEVTYYEM